MIEVSRQAGGSRPVLALGFAILVGGLLAPAVSTSADPDPHCATLEDFYGDTGAHFQGALGLITYEPYFMGTIPPGYGVAIDDMVVTWKETRLDADTHACAGSGECATVELKNGVEYTSNALVEITVTDRTPYDPVNSKNDCNGNGSFADAGDDQDCNDNGTPDVTIKLTSLAEPAGEIAVLDQISGGSPVYRARFPFSSTYDSPGSIYIQRNGTADPVVTAVYDDRDDGTGSRCTNALDPTQQGLVSAHQTVIMTTGRVALKSYTLTLVGTPGVNGDNDGWADANETLDMAVSFINKSGLDVDDLVATLGTNDPNIACISRSIVSLGSVPNHGTVTSPPFRFKVANVSRSTVDDVLRATFTLTLHSNKFDALTRSMNLVLELDLSSGATPGTNAFNEDFEASLGFGKFTTETLDAGRNSLALSDGFRCQYNDPDAPNTQSPGETECFLGFATDPTSGVNDWHVHKNNGSNGNVGRAYTGVQSLHYGVHIGLTAKRDTTRLKQIDAIRTSLAVNLPPPTANPELVFAHQASFVDGRLIKVDPGEAFDRGVVQIQLANSNGTPMGNWLKINAYENEYDQQGTDDYVNCGFDPTDDGNNEDSYFDPTDPNRRYGPSSTCYPEFAFVRSGCTDYRSPTGNPKGTCPADNSNIGLAFDGPGLKGGGSLTNNPGTWVRPRFSLMQYAGRRLRFRFLVSSFEIGTANTWDATTQRDDLVSDDGWYIDDVRIDTALGVPLTLQVDTSTVTPLSCGTCSNITPVLTASPPSSGGPGQMVTLEAKTSTIDFCPSGIPQYQFWIDANANGIVGDAGDVLLRDFTDRTNYLDAPQMTMRYGVKVRCSTDPNCDALASGNTTFITYAVSCPTTGTQLAKLGQTLTVTKPTLTGAEPDQSATVTWGTITTVDVVRGDLAALRASQSSVTCGPSGCDGNGSFTGTVAACLGNNLAAASVADNTPAGAGAAFYWLARPAFITYCNQTGVSWSANGAIREDATTGRDAQIAADGNTCP